MRPFNFTLARPTATTLVAGLTLVALASCGGGGGGAAPAAPTTGSGGGSGSGNGSSGCAVLAEGTWELTMQLAAGDPINASNLTLDQNGCSARLTGTADGHSIEMTGTVGSVDDDEAKMPLAVTLRLSDGSVKTGTIGASFTKVGNAFDRVTIDGGTIDGVDVTGGTGAFRDGTGTDCATIKAGQWELTLKLDGQDDLVLDGFTVSQDGCEAKLYDGSFLSPAGNFTSVRFSFEMGPAVEDKIEFTATALFSLIPSHTTEPTTTTGELVGTLSASVEGGVLDRITIKSGNDGGGGTITGGSGSAK